MTINEEIESLIEQVGELSAEAQTALFEFLVQTHSQHLGIENID